MKDYQYSYREFEEDIYNFSTISNTIHDGWEQKETETIKYLHKTETLEISDPESYEVLANDDLSCCKMESKGLFRKEYSIVYSESFNAPMLYFNFYKAGNC
jgi:hypothetical protein